MRIKTFPPIYSYFTESLKGLLCSIDCVHVSLTYVGCSPRVFLTALGLWPLTG